MPTNKPVTKKKIKTSDYPELQKALKILQKEEVVLSKRLAFFRKRIVQEIDKQKMVKIKNKISKIKNNN